MSIILGGNDNFETNIIYFVYFSETKKSLKSCIGIASRYSFEKSSLLINFSLKKLFDDQRRNRCWFSVDNNKGNIWANAETNNDDLIFHFLYYVLAIGVSHWLKIQGEMVLEI